MFHEVRKMLFQENYVEAFLSAPEDGFLVRPSAPGTPGADAEGEASTESSHEAQALEASPPSAPDGAKAGEITSAISPPPPPKALDVSSLQEERKSVSDDASVESPSSAVRLSAFLETPLSTPDAMTQKSQEAEESKSFADIIAKSWNFLPKSSPLAKIRLPIRLYLVDRSAVTSSEAGASPIDAEDEARKETSKNEVLLKTIPPARMPSIPAFLPSDEDPEILRQLTFGEFLESEARTWFGGLSSEAATDLDIVIQGLRHLHPDTPMLHIADRLCSADQFLHIVVRKI